MATYGIAKRISLPFEEAVQKVTQELQKEGFGVLTTIDVKETLRKKLNVEFQKYVILGACNPPFAYKALQADNQIGLLLPCNVVIQESKEGTMISAFDPMSMGKIMDNDAIEPVAAEMKKRLERVIQQV